MTTVKDIQALYKQDPSNFEKNAQDLIEQWISTRPIESQQRLQSINWRIQQHLTNIKDPVARMNKMVELMWEGVFDLQEALNKHQDILPDTNITADIVKLRTKN